MAVKGDRAIWEAESEGIALLNTTFGEVLEQQAQRSPDKEGCHTEFCVMLCSGKTLKPC